MLRNFSEIMKKYLAIISLQLFAFFLFTSCLTNKNLNSIQVEILRPSILPHPEKIDTISIITRNHFKTENEPFRYSFITSTKTANKVDSNIHYQDLKVIVADALCNYLSEQGYFPLVINYRATNSQILSKEDSLVNYPEFLKKSGAHALVILEDFELEDEQIRETNYWFSGIKDIYPEFSKSSVLEKVLANLRWKIYQKWDTVKPFQYHFADNVYYGNSVYPEFFGNNQNHKKLLENTATYLGRTFGSMIIPSWQNVERMYFLSKDVQMLKGEQFILNNEWTKAAEIYSLEVKSKNRNIAEKAIFNMALICEMDGNIDEAMDWLSRSLPDNKHITTQYAYNCKKYLELLVLRKKEIELLDKQVRNPLPIRGN